jgi:hypothetical protein
VRFGHAAYRRDGKHANATFELPGFPFVEKIRCRYRCGRSRVGRRQAVFGQVETWLHQKHPGWSKERIAQAAQMAVNRAKKPEGPTPASPKTPKQDTSHGVSLKDVVRGVDKALHGTGRGVRSVIVDAKQSHTFQVDAGAVDTAVHATGRAAKAAILHAKHTHTFQVDANAAKIFGREFDKHADSIAVVSSFLAIATAEFPPAAIAFATLADVASAEAGTHAAIDRRPGEAALDFAAVGLGVRGALKRAAEKRAIEDLTREAKKLEKVIDDARKGPLGEPSPRTGEIGTAAERREPSEIAARRRAAETAAFKARAARGIADQLAHLLSLSTWGHAKLVRAIEAAFR